jgi:serine protease inhibitor
MKKLFVLVFILIVAACQDSPVEPDNLPNLRALSRAEVQLSSGVNDFAFRLFENLQKQEPENTFVSPLSVSIAFGMLLNGAEGETQQAILNTIDFGDFTADEVNQGYRDLTELLSTMDRTVTLGIANSLWNDDRFPVHPDFASTINTYYNGEARSLDFAAPSTKNEINGWVEDKTHGKIKDLIETIDPLEVMFLINAIYFKGEWTYQFDPARTHRAPFTNLDGTTAQVDMMFSEGATVHYFADANVRLIDIPYGNEQFNFTVIVPNDESELISIANELTASQLTEWIGSSDSVSVELELPKFKLEWKNDIKENLAAMGMPMANFPRLFQTPIANRISRVIHQSFLEVNEVGSEAAAATAIGIEFTSAPPVPARITIDKPFLFLIREKHSGVILFMGQMVNASVSE